MSYSNLDDKELIGLLQDSNEEAFAEIYNRYWNRIYTLALKFIKSPAAAQDLVQDVFVKIWTNRGNLTQVRDFKPFLFVSARNSIISNLRSSVFHVSLHPDEEIEEELFLPEKQLSYKESVDLLHKAIELLPPQQKTAYKLSRDEGMRYEDIAEKMGISKLTVRTHMTKAINSIRDYLNENGANAVLVMIFLSFEEIFRNFF